MTKPTKLSIAVEIVKASAYRDLAIKEIVDTLNVTRSNAGVYYFKAMKIINPHMVAPAGAPSAPAHGGFVCSDGGMKSSGFKEHNDCAVRAYVHFKDVSYDKAHALFKANGRKDRKGTHYFTIMKVLGRTNEKGGMTVNQLMRQHPGKTMYVVIRRHALAIVNGIIHDTFKSGGKSRVEKFWIA